MDFIRNIQFQVNYSYSKTIIIYALMIQLLSLLILLKLNRNKSITNYLHKVQSRNVSLCDNINIEIKI